MSEKETNNDSCQTHCCSQKSGFQINRRDFLAGLGAAFIGSNMLLETIAAESFMASFNENLVPSPPLPLRIQPVLAVELPRRREKTSWRSWGAFHTNNDIEQEKKRIKNELEILKSQCEFQLEILPLVTLNDANKAKEVAKGSHDVLLMYPANSWVNVLEALTNPEKWTIIFIRHRSGPVYLWYEIIHNRYLRKTIDEFGQQGIDYKDVVVDSTGELKWRLRSLFGLKNTLNKKVVCIGGPAGWGVGGQRAPELTSQKFRMELQTVPYEQLAKLIQQAKENKNLVENCRIQSDKYLGDKDVTLETEKKYVENAFVLAEIFKSLMNRVDTDAITVNHCMGTIMGMSETTACLTLSILNDAGYQAFCESDLVVIPSGILLHHISSLPVFLNDPTFPHDGIVTLAHCTAPRKMNGKVLEPAKILTHFESDYGAAPKVEMKIGQKVTVIDPDFKFKQWLGFEAEIINNPFLDICRSQVDLRINGDCDRLNALTKGFHWMLCYDNYLNEVGYALTKLGIEWINLSA